MKIAVIIGSPRKESFTRIFCNYAADYAEELGHEVMVIDLRKENLDYFKGYEEKYSENTSKIVKSMEDFDAFIIGTPVYNGMLSSALKNLFEHVNYKGLVGKTASYIINADGDISYLQVQGQLNGLLAYFAVVSNPKAVHASPEDYDEDKGEILDGIKKRIEQLVDRTIELAD